MKLKLPLFAAFLAGSCAVPCLAQVPEMKTFEDSLAYVVGVDIAKNLTQMGVNLDPAMLAEGYRAQKDNQSVLSEESIAMVMQTFQMRMMEKSGHSQPPQADPEIRAKGEAWLAANATREGVVTTASGLQYKVLEKGKGKSPLLQDQVTVHYEGHKIDGTSFDSSYDRGEPATFPLSNVIRGWQEGLQLMKPGAKYELYIPSGLAYGPQGMPPTIAPDEVLLFTVELISIQAAPPQPKTPNPRSPGQ